MAFPYDEMDDGERVLLDVNPVFSRLVRPMLELVAITGIVWLLIGVIDGPYIGGSDLLGVRTLLLLAWPVLIAWRVGLPLMGWLGRRVVITDRQFLLREGALRHSVIAIDLRSIRGVDRRGSQLAVVAGGWGPPIVIDDVPGTRRIARMLAGR